MKGKPNVCLLFILLAASLWGTAGIFVRSVTGTGMSEMQLVFARAAFASALIGLILLVRDRRLFAVRRRDLWLFAVAGIGSIVLFNYCYYKTMALASLSVAAVLLYTAPIFVMILSVFLFRQKLTLQKLLTCLLAFLGCCLISGVLGSGESIGPAALGFGLLTGFGYSLYTVFSELLLRRGYHSLTITFYTFVFAALGCLPFVNLGKTVLALAGNGRALGICLLMALLNTVIPYILYTVGLTGVEASSAPIFATLEPVVATVIGTVIYREPLTGSGLAGIVLVLVSVLNLNRKAGKRHESADTAS